MSVYILGVEAEVKVVIPTGEGGASGKTDRKQWDYDEGKDGKYTCAQCGKKPVRSWFLIEAMDDPELYEALQDTARKFKEWKRIQAEKADCMDYLSLLYCLMLYEDP